MSYSPKRVKWNYIAFFRAYLVTILKVLILMLILCCCCCCNKFYFKTIAISAPFWRTAKANASETLLLPPPLPLLISWRNYCMDATVGKNYQNFIEMTSNIIDIVAFGVGFKCPRKIHLNTQCPPRRIGLTYSCMVYYHPRPRSLSLMHIMASRRSLSAWAPCRKWGWYPGSEGP